MLRPVMTVLAEIEHVDVIGDLDRLLDVLIDDQDGEFLLASFAISSYTKSTSFGIRPTEGSSSSSVFGPVMVRRAISSMRCSPPESAPAFRRRRSWSPGKRA